MTPAGLDAADVGAADRPDQVRVLADRLLDPPPPQVARHVQHRGQALVDAERGHGGADRRAHALDERRVEAGPPAQRRGEDRRPPGGQPRQALLVHQRRDAEPAARHDVALGGRHPPGSHLGIDGGGAERTGQLAQARPDELVPRHRRAGHVVLVRSDAGAGAVGPDPHAVQLCHPLLDGHLRHEQRHALVDVEGRVTPGRGVLVG
jgi:hypothetical protein